jgi:hypothetical protein
MAKDKKDRPPVGPDTEYARKRQDKLLDTQRDGREIGRRQGFNRQQRSAELGGCNWNSWRLHQAAQLSLLLLKWAKLKQLSLLWVVHQSVLTVLQCAAKPVEKWSDVFNLSTNLIE